MNKQEHTLQYVVEYETYAGNDCVTQYIDGAEQGHDIMSYWETDGYCRAIENLGYVRAYDADEASNAVRKAEEALAAAQQHYQVAAANPLMKPRVN